MARGGKRTGAGRKKGAVQRVTRDVVERVLPDGISPLEIILQTARAMWKDAQVIDEKTGAVTIDLAKAKEAAVVADRALAYCHARISSVEPPPAAQPAVVEESTVIEEARLLAFAITMGIRERSKNLALPKPKKAKA